MAVVTVKSAAIIAADTPGGKGGLTLGPRRLYEAVSTVEVTNGDSVGSQFRLARVHSSVRMSQILIKCDAITAAAADFGVYDTPQNGGLVVDADAFGSAVALATAIVATPLDVLHESGVLDIAEIEQPLWQILGLTSDPGKEFDIVATLTAAATASGTLTAHVRYAQGN
ncbi:hypothetical protein [Eleftheria terrae]|uniref:hypothetical protein n=1 Tax=Eleftheria terrae TaxID=1597781 RepID=UPI00263AD4B7|nr:hypothetical protein [Eleftheria terrae]WKB53018.1 hypothetical protein N7L95_01025 [Eleftheria terrae]